MSETNTEAGGRYYTTTTCPGRDGEECGARIDGIRHRYWCPICDWISPPDQPAESADT